MNGVTASDKSPTAASEAPSPSWMAEWQPVVERVGSLLDEPDLRFGPDPVELGAIRRWLEPLEFDCALHRHPEVARAHGWPDVIAPYTAVWAFLMPPVWQPGDPPTYGDAARNTQPAQSSIADDVIPGAPPTSAVFGTGISMEFVRPLVVGERVAVGPRRLVACVPKQTRVGRGAFVTFDREFFADGVERIGWAQAQIYLYNPYGGGDVGNQADGTPSGEQRREGPDGPRPLADVSGSGEQLAGATYPLPVHRLIVAAGATRDFSAIHHNDEVARERGAPAMFANAGLLLGMWERVLRDYIGPAGRILAIRDFRMVRFSPVGSVARVEGRVVDRMERDGLDVAVVELRTLVGDTVTVGPGRAEVTLG